MRILLIGGTVFLGRTLVQLLREQGDDVTVFHRGKYPHAPQRDDITTIIGDRKNNLDLLDGQQWDAVIDTCGYFPADVRLSAEYLQDKVQRYVFISSISVYKDNCTPNADEDYPCGETDEPNATEITGENYGPLKHLCEREVVRTYGERATIIRPGLIVGAFDPSDRFSYWIQRAARGGEILAPQSPEKAVQFIDVRDLADFCRRLIQQNTGGVFNATSPAAHYRMGTVLQTAIDITQTQALIHWASDEFLMEQQVQPWMGLPLWIPESPDTIGFYSANVTKALAAGLTLRALEDTIAYTYTWIKTRPSDYIFRAGISQEQEQKLLALWKESQWKNTVQH